MVNIPDDANPNKMIKALLEYMLGEGMPQVVAENIVKEGLKK